MVAALLDEAQSLIAVAAKSNWGDLTGAEAADLLIDAERIVRQAQVIRAGILDRVATSNEHKAYGHASAAGLMQQRCGTKRSTANQVARDGRLLRRCPGVDEAARAGRIDMDKARLIAALNQGRTAAAYDALEPYLVDCAEHMRFADFNDEIDKVHQTLDPQGSDDDADKIFEDRFVNLVGSGWGCAHLEGWLEPLTRATVQRELDRLERELFEADWAEAKDRLGRDPELDELARTAAQRRHDALGLMAERSAAYSGRIGPNYCVNLHMSWATFFAELARLDGRDDLAFPEDHLCELDDGTVIPPSLAVNAAFAGWVRRVVIGPAGELVDFGRAKRFFTRVQRQAIIARSRRRRCAHEHGCDVAATRCECDHVDEYEDGGRTDVANGDLECRPHNRWKNQDKRRRRRPPDDPAP